MKGLYTPRQGQFLVFIHQYTALHGRPPAEAEMAQFFQITPSSVHSMVLTLERRGFITRTPDEARSIRINLPPEKLPPFHDTSATTKIRQPLRQAAGQQLPAVEAAMVCLGKVQIGDIFANYDQYPIDDSEFIPLLGILIKSFGRAGLGAARVKELRRHACELYHHSCQEAEPKSTFEENMNLMFSYLPGARRWI